MVICSPSFAGLVVAALYNVYGRLKEIVTHSFKKLPLGYPHTHFKAKLIEKNSNL
jgi:hypothetical protein